MRLIRGGYDSERGLTLMEVLFALLISGIILVTGLSLLTDQWRGARALKNHLEAHYAIMTAGKTVSTEIRSAQTVEWVTDTCVLKILPMPADSNPVPTVDAYFIDDLDYDGTKDLYWKHLVAKEPLASYITGWECVEVEPGLWDVFLEASVEGQRASWRSSIRQRSFSPTSRG
ncbi:type II secretion system protein [Desulfosporosinus sp. Sb-LF]|uniref:PulJ/GspJ family protein n=1 Tax=Desulfosporosinus sp. Sb-LF TaxID=2560027 RepID=UPI00107FBC26|nr:type II secretion system protein [Desulfosporosinus sp. Sb-LF]TGE34208.1 type II secretion system protein [Desulfosporosinus sp. Sb-LF]